jgi:hypothetical protein
MMSGLALGSMVLLSACSDSNNGDSGSNEGSMSSVSLEDSTPAENTNVEFEITLTNLTAGQPLSPAAIILHDQEWHSFKTGHVASNELEQLAEGGDNNPILSMSREDDQVFLAESGTGIIAPGHYETFQVHTSENNLGTLSLSVLSMLVNSNDAIVALNGETLSSLDINESTSFDLLTYDTGTEANSETADTIPGPAADGGLREGYNSVRDDVRNAIYVHAGVVTNDDGLSSSTLSEIHRWDHPAVNVKVERIR